MTEKTRRSPQSPGKSARSLSFLLMGFLMLHDAILYIFLPLLPIATLATYTHHTALLFHQGKYFTWQEADKEGRIWNNPGKLLFFTLLDR